MSHFYPFDSVTAESYQNTSIAMDYALQSQTLLKAGILVADGVLILPSFFQSSVSYTKQINEVISLEPDALHSLAQYLHQKFSHAQISVQLFVETMDGNLINNSRSFSAACITVDVLENIFCDLLEKIDPLDQRHCITALIEIAPAQDSTCSGNYLSFDPESGFEDLMIINAHPGLKLNTGQTVNCDEFHLSKIAVRAHKNSLIGRNNVQKVQQHLWVDGEARTLSIDSKLASEFCLTESQLQQLGSTFVKIEDICQQHLSIQWLYNESSKQFYFMQLQFLPLPDTSSSPLYQQYLLQESAHILIEGRSIGQKIASGPVRLINEKKDLSAMREGDVLVADMTEPDWQAYMSKASAIVTDRGGRTCHAAIVARELGIPAVVGCLNARERLKTESHVTVSCAEGDNGFVYQGQLDFSIKGEKHCLHPLPFELLMNIGNPDRVLDYRQHPTEGVGLARLEFIINRMIGIHPKALLMTHKLPANTQKSIALRTRGFKTPVDFYLSKLTEGIATIANAFFPKKVTVRLSDFKSNEYAHLIGGDFFEPKEENPMLGFRGASRYISEGFQDCFNLECQALKFIREDMGFVNIEIMVPFCRTPGEAKQVIELLGENGLRMGKMDYGLL